MKETTSKSNKEMVVNFTDYETGEVIAILKCFKPTNTTITARNSESVSFKDGTMTVAIKNNPWGYTIGE